MSNYPPVGHIELVPCRVRAVLGGEVVLDTTEALYVWEWPHHPQYYIPTADVKPPVLVDEQHAQKLRGDTVLRHGAAARAPGRRHLPAGLRARPQ